MSTETLLALPWDADFDGVPVVLCPMAGMRQKTVENAGHAFFDQFEKSSKAEQSTEASGSEEETDGQSGDGGVDQPKEKKQSKTQEAKGTWGQLKISEAIKGHNLYELIGVEEDASQEEIKKQYRKKALEMHPDKQQNSGLSKEELDLRFVRVQDAYELLSDPMQRKKYDSTLDFDDTVPKFNAETQEFFEVFEPAFKRFARWSSKKPVPSIGDAETPLETVKKFYDFWHKFDSWRDPLELAALAEEEIMDLEEAECREERRWMERENAKVARKYKQAEKDNIMLLVKRAENNDPRILADKEAKRAARQAEKDAKDAVARAKREAAEAELKKQQEEEQRIAEEKEAKRREEKEKRDAEKAELKKQRQRLRQAASAGCPEQHCAAQLQQVCLLVDRETIIKVADELEAAKENVEQSTAAVHAFIRSQGLEPIIPEPEEAEVEVELTEEEKEKQRLREERRKQQEAEQAAKDEEAAKLKAEKQAKQAEEQRKKNAKKQAEREKADAKRRQAEKKEAERAAKAEEAEKKAKKEAELAAQAKAAAAREAEAAKRLAALEEAEQEKLAEVFEAELSAKLDKLEGATKESIAEKLAAACAEHSELRGILFELRSSFAAASEESIVERLLDRLLFAASRCGAFSELDVGVTPPALKIGNAVRNKAKKLRTTLRIAAKEALSSATPKAEKQSVKDEVLKKVLQGTADLQQLMVPKIEKATLKQVEVVEEVKEEAPKKGKKGKKAKEEESLDDIFAEMGIEIPAGKKKKNKKKN